MSDSEDDWERADVPEGTFARVDSAAIEAERAKAEAEAEAQRRAADEARRDAERRAAEKSERDALPVLLVDLTAIDPGVHNRADKHGERPERGVRDAATDRSEYAAFAAEHASDGVAVATTRARTSRAPIATRRNAGALLGRVLPSVIASRRDERAWVESYRAARGDDPSASLARGVRHPYVHGNKRDSVVSTAFAPLAASGALLPSAETLARRASSPHSRVSRVSLSPASLSSASIATRTAATEPNIPPRTSAPSAPPRFLGSVAATPSRMTTHS